MKAVFQSLGAEAWGHSVADLLTELGRRRQLPGHLIDAGLELDKAYIPARYPNAHPSGSPRTRYTRGEAERLIRHAEDEAHAGPDAPTHAQLNMMETALVKRYPTG